MKFKITPQSIPDVLLIEPTVYADDRGYFKESYNLSDFEEFLPGIKFVQDNESKSREGVLRGLHFQKPPYSQAKLMKVFEGTIWDVAIDIRKGSPTFLKHVSVELSSKNHKQLYIPRGFAHGFIVLSDVAAIQYKTDCYYNAESDTGIHPYDTTLNIPWPLSPENHVLSEKDRNLPFLGNYPGLHQ
jgi:dTDP-4-dehydrorhamnose 3,5-epimerase